MEKTTLIAGVYSGPIVAGSPFLFVRFVLFVGLAFYGLELSKGEKGNGCEDPWQTLTHAFNLQDREEERRGMKGWTAHAWWVCKNNSKT